MKNIKISSFVLILIIVFFILHFVGYGVVSNHVTSDHEKNTKILFYEIKNHTSNLLSKLLNEHHMQKELLKNKHKIVLEYMNSHDLNVSLETEKEIKAFHELVKQYPSIKDIKAYGIDISGSVYEIVLEESDASYNPAIKSLLISKEKARLLINKLLYSDFMEETFIKGDTPYRLLYMSSNSNVNKDMKIIYSVLLDESDFYARLKALDILIIFISILGAIGIFIMIKLRNNEVRLSDQDTFVQSAMHEIKTPLSIITLNNELRQLEQGTDTYSEEIDNALKVLHNSYRSMSYIMQKDQLIYEPEILNLSQIVEQRIAYFQTIAVANDKKILFDINSHCRVNISLIELTRLIDNSIYNAIKYSAVGSDIKVVLSKNILSFHNKGDAIENKEKVFHKYFRENTTVGGYGLGLNIIKGIADKYGIAIQLQSDIKSGTTFTYIFKCHTNDISEE